jgi:hypothetical protein
VAAFAHVADFRMCCLSLKVSAAFSIIGFCYYPGQMYSCFAVEPMEKLISNECVRGKVKDKPHAQPFSCGKPTKSARRCGWQEDLDEGMYEYTLHREYASANEREAGATVGRRPTYRRPCVTTKYGSSCSHVWSTCV